MALIDCPNCNRIVWDGANECPHCKCNVKKRLAEMKNEGEKKKRLEQVCPECNNLPSKITYYEEFFIGHDFTTELKGYTEITLLKCSNCGWETKISGAPYEYKFLFDGADVNRPGTKDHKIYNKRYCEDCGKEIFHGSQSQRCPDCDREYWHKYKLNNDLY